MWWAHLILLAVAIAWFCVFYFLIEKDKDPYAYNWISLWGVVGCALLSFILGFFSLKPKSNRVAPQPVLQQPTRRQRPSGIQRPRRIPNLGTSSDVSLGSRSSVRDMAPYANPF